MISMQMSATSVGMMYVNDNCFIQQQQPNGGLQAIHTRHEKDVVLDKQWAAMAI